MSLECSELGHLHRTFLFSALAYSMHLQDSPLGHKSHFSAKGKTTFMVLGSYTNFSDFELIEHLNGNIRYQMFCEVQTDLLYPLTNYKIVSAIV